MSEIRKKQADQPVIRPTTTSSVPPASPVETKAEATLPPDIAQSGTYGAPPSSEQVMRAKSFMVNARVAAKTVISPEGATTPKEIKRAWTEAYAGFERALSDPLCKRAVLVVGVDGDAKREWVRKNAKLDVAYVDATLATPEARKRLIGIAKSAGKPIDAVWITDPKADSKPARQLQQRPPSKDEGLRDIVIVGEYNPPPPHVVYAGVFLSAETKAQLEKHFPPKHDKKFAHHMTIEFQPSDEAREKIDVGKTATLKVVGYAEDDKAQVIVVEPIGTTSTNPIPHITLSTNGTPPAYSNALLTRGYQKIDGPILEGTIGFFMSDKSVNVG